MNKNQTQNLQIETLNTIELTNVLGGCGHSSKAPRPQTQSPQTPLTPNAQQGHYMPDGTWMAGPPMSSTAA